MVSINDYKIVLTAVFNGTNPNARKQVILDVVSGASGLNFISETYSSPGSVLPILTDRGRLTSFQAQILAYANGRVPLHYWLTTMATALAACRPLYTGPVYSSGLPAPIPTQILGSESWLLPNDEWVQKFSNRYQNDWDNLKLDIVKERDLYKSKANSNEIQKYYNMQYLLVRFDGQSWDPPSVE